MSASERDRVSLVRRRLEEELSQREASERLGLRRPKKRRVKRVFQLRERRPRFGGSILIDGSPPAWFEGRGSRCTPIAFTRGA